ncbi:MAG: hypothetical protein QOE70_4788 [Chthoniobacter sp.]|jgi:hypothetical protein|nr:hypothetical protein [Chthoniobacter sp.]
MSAYLVSTRRRKGWGVLAGSIAGLLVLAEADAEPGRPLFRNTVTLRPFLAGPETVQEVPPRSPTQFNPDPGSWDDTTPPVFSPAPRDPVHDSLFPDHMPDYGNGPLPESLRLPRGRVIGRDPIKKTFTYREYPLGREGLGILPNSRGVPNRWTLPFPHWTRYHDPSHETAYMYETPRLWHPFEQSILKGDVPIIGQDIFANLTAKNFTLYEYRKLPVGSGVSAALPSSAEFFGRSAQNFVSNDTSFSLDLFQGETAFKPVTWLFRVNGVYNQNYIRVLENNLVDPDPRGPGFDDNKGNPNTTVIQAIKPESQDVGPRPGDPGSFTKTVNPGDLFNYIAPQLQPLGDARPLVKVDPLTQEVPEDKDNELDKKNKKNQRHDLAGTRYTTRHKDFFALQEAFLEIHFSDLTDNYDFISSRTGIQPFVSDFRGFIFADTNLGARVFGNADNNRTQYNLVYFNMREKDTYSDLNTFESRHQQVLIANVFRQDALWKGYTAQMSFHMNLDDGGTHYDKNGFLTRPSILGTIPDEGDFLGSDGGLRGHDVKAFYLGWTGDGHIGRLNITHALYQVFGEDKFNQLAGRRVDINAQMAALELSYDRDWIRLKLSGFYASGDSDPSDRTARGFDTIQDNPLFIGGPFSWYVHQGFNLAGTGVNFKQRDSLVLDLRTSKSEGQSNFVNPGVMIAGIGSDMDLTPKLKLFANVNHIWLSETAPIEKALQTNKSRTELGLDTSLGFKFRPLLTDNIILSIGAGLFFPGAGYRDIYRRATTRVPGFSPTDEEGKVDRYLYNGFVTLTFLY